jgi:glycosyltransferase involved in cell wall biosynthesis
LRSRAAGQSINSLPIEAQYTLAKAWLQKGVAERAVAGFREVLKACPDHQGAAQSLADFLLAHGRYSEAADVYRHGLALYPNQARLHKGFVDVLVAGPTGLDEAFRHYQLTQVTPHRVCVPLGQVLCCTVVRNERQRLPFFLQYYRERGIEAFFAVDNGSTDGSTEYLAAQPDVYLWQSTLSFNQANFGAGWFEPILRRHGLGKWVLIVDADELLYYPDCERVSIPELCSSLDRKGKRAFHAVHLDMYSAVPIRDTVYAAGQDFREVCPYFDRKFFHRSAENAGQFRNQRGYFGGARERVFGAAGEYYLSKAPLIRYDADCTLTGGQHCTSLGAALIAAESGCLLHFKYFASFGKYVAEESERGEHYSGAMQYREYKRGLDGDQALTLFDPEHSVKLEGSEQLLALGVIARDVSTAGARPAAVFPAIAAVPAGSPRPFWSVFITAYRRSEYVKKVLESVLRQGMDAASLQVEVVSDGPDHAIQDEIAEVVRLVSGGSVPFFRNPFQAGHPGIFNLCLERARGQWIHLLHDDDWVAPGFYEHLQRGITQAPEVGAAFCRHLIVDEHEKPVRISRLERDDPGVVPEWLFKIGTSCRLQTPSIVVKRAAYEQVGGYCPQAKSAFDWEMWTRLAVHYPFWFEPKTLAYFRQHSASESTGLVESGAQISDTRAAIEIANEYLPEDLRGVITAKASQEYAIYGLEHARRHLENGNYEAAWANVREAVKCTDNELVQRVLLSLVKGARVNTRMEEVNEGSHDF